MSLWPQGAHEELPSSPRRGQSTSASLRLLGAVLLRTNSVACCLWGAWGCEKRLLAGEPPSCRLGRGICSDWQVEERSVPDTSLDLSHPVGQRRLSRSLDTVVNQKQANHAA